MTSRAYTIEEVRETFMRHLAELANYAANEERWVTPLDKCNGLVFSILNIFDGTSAAFPAMNISLYPHPSDKEYHQKEGSNWYEPGMVFNDEYLHESWHRYERKPR